MHIQVYSNNASPDFSSYGVLYHLERPLIIQLIAIGKRKVVNIRYLYPPVMLRDKTCMSFDKVFYLQLKNSKQYFDLNVSNTINGRITEN